MKRRNKAIEFNIKDGEGRRKFKQFFENFVDEFVNKNKNYFAETNDVVYRYRELQLNTVIAPILEKISNAFLCEHPTTRGLRISEKEDSFGRIDFWVKDGSAIYLIELKHGFNGLGSGILRDATKSKWKKAKEQLSIIKEDPEVFRIGKNDNILKVALMVITTYTSKLNNEANNNDCSQISQLIKNELVLKHDYAIAELVAFDDMQCIFDYTNGSESYPYLHIVAQIIS